MNSSRPDDAIPELDETIPNRAANQEKAEGSRENVNIPTGDQGGGITNRPLQQERREQQSVPPRGENKDGGHA